MSLLFNLVFLIQHPRCTTLQVEKPWKQCVLYFIYIYIFNFCFVYFQALHIQNPTQHNNSYIAQKHTNPPHFSKISPQYLTGQFCSKPFLNVWYSFIRPIILSSLFFWFVFIRFFAIAWPRLRLCVYLLVTDQDDDFIHPSATAILSRHLSSIAAVITSSCCVLIWLWRLYVFAWYYLDIIESSHQRRHSDWQAPRKRQKINTRGWGGQNCNSIYFLK